MDEREGEREGMGKSLKGKGMERGDEDREGARGRRKGRPQCLMCVDAHAPALKRLPCILPI